MHCYLIGRRLDTTRDTGTCLRTEVQLLSIVCSTGGRGSKPHLWNIQNLGAVPPYEVTVGSASSGLNIICSAHVDKMVPDSDSRCNVALRSVIPAQSLATRYLRITGASLARG